jgi:hypothetical protein
MSPANNKIKINAIFTSVEIKAVHEKETIQKIAIIKDSESTP